MIIIIIIIIINKINKYHNNYHNNNRHQCEKWCTFFCPSCLSKKQVNAHQENCSRAPRPLTQSASAPSSPKSKPLRFAPRPKQKRKPRRKSAPAPN